MIGSWPPAAHEALTGKSEKASRWRKNPVSWGNWLQPIALVELVACEGRSLQQIYLLVLVVEADEAEALLRKPGIDHLLVDEPGFALGVNAVARSNAQDICPRSCHFYRHG
jgi:hypothetical protein